MYPSVHTIQTRLGISREKANQVRGLMDKSRIKTSSFESVRAWEAQCFNKPEWVERCLCAIDEVSGNARILDRVEVYGDAVVSGSVVVSGAAVVSGTARIHSGELEEQNEQPH